MVKHTYILFFGSSIQGTEFAEEIEKVQQKCGRILGVNNSIYN